jgi:hypothetical protein
VLSVLQLNPAGADPAVGQVKMLVQNGLLLLLPWRPWQSKAPSTPNTKAFQ